MDSIFINRAELQEEEDVKEEAQDADSINAFIERYVRQMNDPEYQKKIREDSESRVEKLLTRKNETLAERPDLLEKDVYFFVKLNNFKDDVPVWRRIKIASFLPLSAVSIILNAAMGWSFNYHGYRFDIFLDDNEKRAAACEDSGAIDMMHTRNMSYANAHTIPLGSVLPRSYGKRYQIPKQMSESEWKEFKESRGYKKYVRAQPQEDQTLMYTYDLGDDWSHNLFVEKLKPRPSGTDTPICELLEGSGACPPEDAGGFRGYRGMIENFKNPEANSIEAREHMEWLHSVSNIQLVNGKLDPNNTRLDSLKSLVNDINTSLELTYAEEGGDVPTTPQSGGKHTRPGQEDDEESNHSSPKKLVRKCCRCGKTSQRSDTKLRKCSRCRVVRYCGRECQKRDWKKHKKRCVPREE